MKIQNGDRIEILTSQEFQGAKQGLAEYCKKYTGKEQDQPVV